MTTKTKALEDILPKRISETFTLVEIAEAEIERAQKRWPKKRRRLYRSFMLLVPNVYLHTPLLFRRHCRELLRRIAQGRGTQAPTRAELIGVFSRMSEIVPPIDSAVLAYARMFIRLFPKAARGVWSEKELVSYEDIHGVDADEVLNELRKKMWQKDRILTKPKTKARDLFDD